MRTFLVNETSENVWFDQFRIQNTTPVILQETHYDPWGVELQGLGYQQAGIKANKYLYNAKEFNDHLGINLSDYGARMYDASIGRWFVVDPLAEIPSQIAHSPYAYAWNNPISMIDPTGMSAEACKDCPPPPGWDDPKKGKPMDEVVVSATRLDDSSTGMLSGRSGNSTWDNQRAQMGWHDFKESNQSEENLLKAASVASYLLGNVTTGIDLYKDQKLAQNNLKTLRRTKALGSASYGATTTVRNSNKFLTGLKIFGKGLARPLFGVGILLSGVDVYSNNFSNESLGWALADTGVGALGLAAGVIGVAFGAPVVGSALVIGSAGYFTYRLGSELINEFEKSK